LIDPDPAGLILKRAYYFADRLRSLYRADSRWLT
jgi:hypothetical protein